jgi:hypothetical protein
MGTEQNRQKPDFLKKENRVLFLVQKPDGFWFFLYP